MILVWAVRNCAGHSSKVINRFLEEVFRARAGSPTLYSESFAPRSVLPHARVHRWRAPLFPTIRRFFRARAGSPYEERWWLQGYMVLPRTRGPIPRDVIIDGNR
jgi:hypothetical protein